MCGSTHKQKTRMRKYSMKRNDICLRSKFRQFVITFLAIAVTCRATVARESSPEIEQLIFGINNGPQVCTYDAATKRIQDVDVSKPLSLAEGYYIVLGKGQTAAVFVASSVTNPTIRVSFWDDQKWTKPVSVRGVQHKDYSGKLFTAVFSTPSAPGKPRIWRIRCEGDDSGVSGFAVRHIAVRITLSAKQKMSHSTRK